MNGGPNMLVTKTVKLGVVIALGLGLSACNSTRGTDSASVGRAAAPQTLPPLEPQVVVFLRNAGAATFMADTCPGERLKAQSRRALVAEQIDVWKARGYSTEQISKANAAARKKETPELVISYLEARGARPGDPGSVCRVAARERAEKTAVGALLKG